MKRKTALSVLFLLSLFCSTGASPVLAHPADVYTHSIHVTLAEEDLSIRWEIKPGPMLVSYLWSEADANADGAVSENEARNWAGSRLSNFSAALDGRPILLNLEAVHFPSDENSFQAGLEFIAFDLSAIWPQGSNRSYRLTIHNGVEEQKSLNWYFIDSRDGIQFRAPEQKNSRISFEVFPPAAPNPAQISLLREWDSSMPSLSSWQGGQGQDVVTQAAEQVVPELAERTPQEVLLDLVRRQEFSAAFYAFALSISLLLGALHALTPGHGKTVVAAYLVGSRGTTRHAIALGSVVTLTHTGSVFLLGVITLAASQYILPTSIIPMLEILSGLLIVGLGFYLLWQRFLFWRRSRAHEQAHVHGLEHDHHLDHGREHGHSHPVPEAITWRSLIALGVSGGLVPCPDAIAILLVAVAINRILLGLALIVSFSLGLAVVLIVIGLLMVNSRRLFDRMGAFEKIAPLMPIVSALVVLALGFGLTYGAYVRAKGSFGSSESEPRPVEGAQVLYLAEDETKVTRLFIAGFNKATSRPITQSANGVIDYALSPHETHAAYIIQTEDLLNEIRLVDLASGEDRKITDCGDAVCSQPVWSPDGNRFVYERMSLSDDNATGLGTLWWVDLETGEARPVFQESQLPGANPRWSPDGKWISYAAPESVRLYNLESGESHVIKSVLGSAAQWSPDSASVSYRDVIIKDNQFVTQLFVYELASRKPVNILPDAGFENILAAWSPDGRRMAVVRRDLSAARGDQIWIIHADGSESRPLTDTPAALHGSLNWSPDGKYLLCDVYALESAPLRSSLQVIEVDSGELTDLGIYGYNPAWLWPR
jgi:ABC-type nickel/cobalt efflux system permease component RcnA/Tol biopolymer transport system component